MPHVTPLLKPYFGLYLTQVAVPKVSTRCCIAGPSLPFQPPSSPPSQGTLLLLPAIPNMHLPHGGGGLHPLSFQSQLVQPYTQLTATCWEPAVCQALF